MNDGIRNEVPVTVHGDNIFLCEAPYRCLPMAKQSVYAKGILQHYTDEKTLLLGQFAVETTNSEVVSYIEQGATIRLQQNLIGAYADCDNVTGAGIQLLKDGVASEFYWYGNQLRKIKKVNDLIEFQYDDNGYRVSKTTYKNGIEISNTKYIIEGNKILKEINHFNDDENDYMITYIYNGEVLLV